MKEKIYIIFKNNEEEYDDYSDWIIEIYKDKEKAENRFVELVKTNQYKKDRAIKSAKYNEDIGAYRIEEHEIENETSEAMSEEEKKAIEFIKNLIAWDVRQDLCPNKEECENLETILNLIEKLQKENEMLKRCHIQDNKNLDFVMANCILKEKVKDKIEALSKTKSDLATYIAVSERIRALQELLKESEDSKNG